MTPPPWIDDYQALTEGRAVALLDSWSTVSATGADAAKLLNNFCTNDVSKLEVGAMCEAFFPNAKGKVLVFGWVWRLGETELRIVIGSDRAGLLAEHLDRYVIREDAAIVAVDESLGLTFSTDTPARHAIALPSLGKRARLLIDPAGDSTGVATEAFNALRIEHGVPLDAVDVDERNLAQEVDRDTTAISFTKGCYLGQETVARVDAMGRVRQKLRLVKLAGDPPAADTALTVDGVKAGRVTSSAWSPKHESAIALAYLKGDHAAAGTRLTCGDDAADVIKPNAARE